MDYEGIFKRLDLAVNDMGGLLDIEILRERYYADKVWKRSRKYEGVDSGKLSGAKGDTAKTFYIGSKNSPIYFCLYEKEKEQRNKEAYRPTSRTVLKVLTQKTKRAGQAVEELIFSRNPGHRPLQALSSCKWTFPTISCGIYSLENMTASLPFIMTPAAVNTDKTIRWLERQVMPFC
ncbi:MAG: replication initiation factor domain-containing protein [Streptococcus sp.]